MYTIKKDWITEAGLLAVIIMTELGHHCGYVAVPKEHSTYGKDYTDVSVDVHGGLTFGDKGDGYPIATTTEVWWFGYDCGHYMDKPDPEFVAKQPEERQFFLMRESGIFRDVQYCTNECESLARQLAAM